MFLLKSCNGLVTSFTVVRISYVWMAFLPNRQVWLKPIFDITQKAIVRLQRKLCSCELITSILYNNFHQNQQIFFLNSYLRSSPCHGFHNNFAEAGRHQNLNQTLFKLQSFKWVFGQNYKGKKYKCKSENRFEFLGLSFDWSFLEIKT